MTAAPCSGCTTVSPLRNTRPPKRRWTRTGGTWSKGRHARPPGSQIKTAGQRPISGHFGTVDLGRKVARSSLPAVAWPPRSAPASPRTRREPVGARRRPRSLPARTPSGARRAWRPTGGQPSQARARTTPVRPIARRTPTLDSAGTPAAAEATTRRPPPGHRPDRRAERPRRPPRIHVRAPRPRPALSSTARPAGTSADRARSPAAGPCPRPGRRAPEPRPRALGDPRAGRAVAAPGSPPPGSRRSPGSISRRPAAVISNQATSPSAPNRFLPAESIRSPERGSPSNARTTSTACSSARGRRGRRPW